MSPFSGENLLLTAMDRFRKLEDVISILELSADHFASAELAVLLPPWKAEDYNVQCAA